jgi:outer membrane protein OmpA-like peptidoglycan-associated protein
MKKNILFFLVIFSGFFQPVYGQSTRSSFGVSVGTTNFWMQNILNNNLSYNYGNFGLSYQYKIDSSYYVYANYVNGGVPDNTGNLIGNYNELKSTYDKFNVSIFKHLYTNSKFLIAAGAGIGFQKSYFQCYNCNIFSNFRQDYNVNVALNLERKISKSASIFLLMEAAGSVYNDLSDSKNIVINNPLGGYDVIKNSNSTQVNISLGLKINIQNKFLDDADKDLVKNKLDKCPDTPKGTKVNSEGCPIQVIRLDTDEDGVIDSLDRCPSTPKGEIVDVAGCSQSQLDDDNDGVFNNKDKCPASSKGIKVSIDGCEIIEDKDGDGVLDKFDNCPTEKGLKSNNGCPEVSETIEKKVLEIANEINYVTNKADLLPASLLKLNELIIILLENPDLNIIISGHTDDVGTDESNLTLSEKRTQSVIDYLTKKGILNDRMTGLSFGESKLKVMEYSDAAREINRRVELKVYKKK